MNRKVNKSRSFKIIRVTSCAYLSPLLIYTLCSYWNIFPQCSAVGNNNRKLIRITTNKIWSRVIELFNIYFHDLMGKLNSQQINFSHKYCNSILHPHIHPFRNSELNSYCPQQSIWIPNNTFTCQGQTFI